MLAYWEGFSRRRFRSLLGDVFLSPKPFITDYQMVLAILKLEFMLYIYIYIGNFVHIDDLHFGPFPLRTTKKGIYSNSPKKGQLFSLHQTAGYVTIKKAAFQPTSVCRKKWFRTKNFTSYARTIHWIVRRNEKFCSVVLWSYAPYENPLRGFSSYPALFLERDFAL